MTPREEMPAGRLELLRQIAELTESLLARAPFEDLDSVREGLAERERLIAAAAVAEPLPRAQAEDWQVLLAHVGQLDARLIAELEDSRTDVARRLVELRKGRHGIRGYGSGRRATARYLEEQG